MESFIARKKAFLEKLKENPEVASSVKNSKYNGIEQLNRFFDPKDEIELSIAEKFFTITVDMIQVIERRKLVSFETPNIDDYRTVPVIDLYRKIILALKNNNNRYLQAIIETSKEEATPESIAELQFQIVSILYGNDAAIEYLVAATGFDIENESSLEFLGLLEKANDVFNLQITNGLLPAKVDPKDPEVLAIFDRQMHRFHELAKQYILQQHSYTK